MKKFAYFLAVLAFSATLFTSCSHGISVFDAANGGKAKCGKNYIGK